MIAGEPSPAIPELRDALAAVRKLLLEPTPQNIDRCRVPLTVAIAGAERLAAAVREDARSGITAGSANELHREVGEISALLDNAASFHASLLANMIAAASAPESNSGGLTRCARVRIDA